MNRLFALAIAVFFGCEQPVRADDAASAVASVVSVLPQWPGRPPNAEEPEGSGVVIGDGRTIVTAAHVLGQAKDIQVRTSQGVILTARLIAADKATDLALLSLKEPLPALQLAGDASLGETACAVGNAFGLGISITCGTVSAVNRSGVGFNSIEDFVQTDAAVNPGASGGALVDSQGRLIGILSAIFTKKSDANVGVNFAVSAPLVRRVVAGLRNRGRINWQFGGLGLRAHPEKGQTGRQAAEIIQVRAGSSGQHAGLMPGDRIIRAGERRVRKPQDLRAALARMMSGDKITLEYVRDGQNRRTELIMN